MCRSVRTVSSSVTKNVRSIARRKCHATGDANACNSCGFENDFNQDMLPVWQECIRTGG